MWGRTDQQPARGRHSRPAGPGRLPALRGEQLTRDAQRHPRGPARAANQRPPDTLPLQTRQGPGRPSQHKPSPSASTSTHPSTPWGLGRKQTPSAEAAADGAESGGSGHADPQAPSLRVARSSSGSRVTPPTRAQRFSCDIKRSIEFANCVLSQKELHHQQLPHDFVNRAPVERMISRCLKSHRNGSAK